MNLIKANWFASLVLVTSWQLIRGNDQVSIASYGGTPPDIRFPLKNCEGDCDNNGDCLEGLVCFQRDQYEAVPGCEGGEADASKTDYCINPPNVPTPPTPTFSPTKAPVHNSSPFPTMPVLVASTPSPVTTDPSLPWVEALYGGNPPSQAFPLGLCKGDCDKDGDCDVNMICFQRTSNAVVPGCNGGEADSSKSDYCVLPPNGPTPATPTAPASPFTPPTPAPASPVTPGSVDPITLKDLESFGGSPPASKFPLGLCEGDCDNNGDCEEGLVCFQRGSNQEVPGCAGTDVSKTDYCVDQDITASSITSFTPGKLTVYKLGLLLSEGLDARLIARTGQKVRYHNGTESNTLFHGRPDAGATFPDSRPENIGGWVYASNSEMQGNGDGGVGALTFDSNGNVIDYKMVLEGTTMNCGGGRTAWNTWVSCEEHTPNGRVFQVDPFGQKAAEEMTIGAAGGNWESFAYDISNKDEPHFFVTEDSQKGALRRFTPSNPVWNNEWGILQGAGIVDYLLLNADQSGTSGTFTWTTDLTVARQNARTLYPNSEGIDAYKDQLFFVSKVRKEIFTLNLKLGTWFVTSTVSGLFDGQPDQLQRLLGDSRDLLYFTEEGGVDAGIHARDKDSRFYTIMESPVYPGETSGLSLSPDGKFMYVAYQNLGLLFTLFRKDGQSFEAGHLDIKYHQQQR